MNGTESAENQLLSLLGDETVQRILTATDERSMSAQMLEARCDASLTTIYRRIEELLEHELLQVRTEVQSDGNHYKAYEARLKHLGVNLRDGALDVEVERRNDAPDRFRDIWDAMQRGED